MRPLFIRVSVAVLGSSIVPGGGIAAENLTTKARPVPSMKARPFDLCDVRLLDGPFERARQADAAYLLALEPDRLLSRFREYAGLKPKGAAYGGWEQESLSGHSLGHYLSACALMFAASSDDLFKKRVDYVVEELALCQKAQGDGLVVGFPGARKAFAEVAAGNIRARRFNLNGIWSPFYTMHKLLAGLRDAHHLGGNRQALDIATRLADWVGKTLAGLSEEQMQEVLACEFGGMNEVLADLYADSGEPRHLALSRRFDHRAVLDPLAAGEDCLEGLHANTQIPKIIGLARRHQLTGDKRDRAIAEFFWQRVAGHHSYVTGGHSESEYFGPPDRLADRLTDRTTETCNTYNMLKLTRLLFESDPRAEYADFYERALFNHILASQDPRSGMVTYFVPLRSGFAKTYSTPFDTFTCCLGTGMENHAQYGDSIYFHDDDTLYVNLFIASELAWKQKGLAVRQETRFPDDDRIVLDFKCAQPVEVALRIRHPFWATEGMNLSVNDQPVKVAGEPGSYVQVRRTWQDQDRMEIRLPMPVRQEAMPDNARRVALFCGPILLVGDLGPSNDSAAQSFGYVPVMLADPRSLLEHIRPVAGEACAFRTASIGQPRDVNLLPFFRLHHRRYAVYWDLLTPEEWAQCKADHEMERKLQDELDALTVDSVQPGQTASETAHQLKGEKMESEDFCGRTYRLSRGAWFSYELKVLPDQPMTVVVTYWGGERPGSRVFNLCVDGEVIAAQNLSTNRPGQFFDVRYRVPEKLTQGKDKVTLAFVAEGEKWAGGIFALRMIRSRGSPD